MTLLFTVTRIALLLALRNIAIPANREL